MPAFSMQRIVNYLKRFVIACNAQSSTHNAATHTTMSKEPLTIRPVANGFIAFSRQAESYIAGTSSDEHTHVFTDPAALGKWVAEYYGASISVPKEEVEESEADTEYNPDGLTDEQVGRKYGWRLLTVSEHKARNCQPETQFWTACGKWSSTSDWQCNEEPLRTKLTPEELAKLP